MVHRMLSELRRLKYLISYSYRIFDESFLLLDWGKWAQLQEMKAPRKGSKNHECQANVTSILRDWALSFILSVNPGKRSIAIQAFRSVQRLIERDFIILGLATPIWYHHKNQCSDLVSSKKAIVHTRFTVAICKLVNQTCRPAFHT